MIQTKKWSFVIFLTFCLMSVPYLHAVTVDAGNKMFKASKNPPVAITVFNNDISDAKVTFIWSSKNQINNGICHKETLLAGQKASYTFTKKQLKGELKIIAIVQPGSQSPEDARIGIKAVSAKNIGIYIPLSNILRDSEYTGNMNKDQIQQLLENQ